MIESTWSDYYRIDNFIADESVLMSSWKSPLIDPWEQAEQRLHELRWLEGNWDDLGGNAPTTRLVDSALVLLSQLRDSNPDLAPQRIVAGPMGEILIEWHEGSDLTEIEIEVPGYAEITRVRSGVPYESWTHNYNDESERGSSWGSPVTDEILEVA